MKIEEGGESTAIVPHSEMGQGEQTALAQMLGDEMDAIRIFVSGGGCGGMSYGMTFSDELTPFDSVLDSGDYKVYVDTVALNYMRGVEIDFVDKGMGEASFVFNNVFAATGGSGGCGTCGSSSGGCGS